MKAASQSTKWSTPPDDTPIEPASPEYVAAVARAVLDVAYSDMQTSPVGQVVIGWIRAAHDQILAVAELVQIGRRSAAGPNIRTIMDVVLRLIWLNTLDDRRAGLRGQFQGEQRQSDVHPSNLTKLHLPLDNIETPPVIDLEPFGPSTHSCKASPHASSTCPWTPRSATKT